MPPLRPPPPRNWTSSREAQLLLAVCRKFIGTLSEDGLIDALRRPVDETKFLKLCQSHRLVLLVHKVLTGPYREAFSDAFLHSFAQLVNQCTVSHLRLSKVAVETHRAFHEKQITHVFLKGPVLAEMLFPGQLLRYSSDLDILVAPKDLIRADLCLRELGFTPDQPGNFLETHSPFSRLLRRDVAYRKQGLPHNLELHWKTHEIEVVLSNPTHTLEDQIYHQAFHGEQMPVLENQLNAIYLCFHAAKHNWSRLRWLMDITIFIPRQNLHWRSLLHQADRIQLRAPVVEAALLMRELFELPNDEALSISRRSQRRSLRRFYLANDVTRSKFGTLRMFLSQGFLFSSPSQRIAVWSFNLWTLIVGLLRRQFFRRIA